MLTDIAVKRLKPQEKPYRKADSGGLAIRVLPNGSKLWQFRYRIGGKENTLSIGPYPAVSLSQARQARDKAKADLRTGRDPNVTRKQEKAAAAGIANRLQAIGEEWLRINTPRWTAKHAGQVKKTLEQFVWPKLGNVPVAEITPPMVLAVIRDMEKRSAIETSRRVCQRISAIFSHAIAHGMTDTNPARDLKSVLLPVVHSPRPALTDIAAIHQLFADVESRPARPTTFLALRFLALTGVRPGEVCGARWDEINGVIWSIPAARMKMKRAHVVPLSRQALEILEVLRTLTGDAPYLFPSQHDINRPLSGNAIGYCLNRAGYQGTHCPHGFRSSMSTIMNTRRPKESAFIELILAHEKNDKVAAVYNRAQYLDERREILQEWGDLLSEGLKPPRFLLYQSTNPEPPSPTSA
ncbi:tyrosine-type recombinase/integrase [Bombella saccharophila]|uniref:Integrase arm-type DNA-binding domain-containing protein n=1 Tax=Bombella saccharophila TaxID=2967338 RepID=A0ABT3W5Q8_9PROT|nr:integrase arm-type DNA-binding domain-containing protein [Bombella saccharophila]MCX5614407.1 integrase arm-type DNA-binding domain-containing protein [Bombella saccharophila]